MPGKYPTDPELIKDLLSLRTEQGMTNHQLSKMLGLEGVTPTFLSKYLNDNLDREVDGFHLIARDIVKGIRMRLAYGTELFETSVTERMGSCFSLIRSTSDIGIITSPAGNGKSSASTIYSNLHPTTVAVTLNATTCEAKRVEAAIFAAVENRDWKGRSSRFSYLVDRFKGSRRLLLLDNAQRLDSTGRQWLFDFCDAAGLPAALIGNPELIDKIRANDQQFSRVGICATYELTEKELPAVSKRVAHQYSDAETAEEIEDLVAVIAAHPGRLRAVEKTVRLAQELRSLSKDLANNPRKAIRAAHARLPRNYALPSD